MRLFSRMERLPGPALAALAALTLVACNTPPTPTATPPPLLPTPTPSPAPADYGTAKGVSLSPRSFESADFLRFLDEAEEMGSILRWAGDWADLAKEGSGADVIATIARQRGMQAMIETGVFSVDSKSLFRPLTPENLASYLGSARAFAAKHKPAYMGIGVEVDFHYDEGPETWPLYVGLFRDVYDAVKAVSPETKVYVVFQLEHTNGLRGGLFGGQNDPANSQWHLLEQFPRSDLIGFTTYPSLVYTSPGEVPDDYYAEIREHTDKPVAFTELGWPHADDIPGWESSELEQAAFVDRLFELVEPVSPEALVWMWMYEQPGARVARPAFWSITLRREDGSARPAWDAWVNGQ